MENGSRLIAMAVLVVGGLAPAGSGAKKTKPPSSPLDAYVAEASARPAASAASSPGSLWSQGARFTDLARDLRASQLDDIVTILVVEQASAVAKGTTKSSRASSATNSVSALAGLTRAAGPLANLAKLGGDQQLAGDGSTSRETVVTTTLSARVTRVLPSGAMVVEGSKTVQVNSEQQLVTVRGVVRSADLTPGNMVRSDRVANLEVRVNGKGVVNDVVRRPFFLYRVLLGLLPF